MDLVAIVHTCDWLDFLAARATGQPWTVRVGKVERPPIVTTPGAQGRGVPTKPVRVYLVAWGRVRGWVPLAALSNSVHGFALELEDLSALEPVTIERRAPWFYGWKEARWNTWPKVERRGGKEGHEVPFPAWATEELPADVAEVAASLASKARMRLAPPPVVAIEPAPPVPQLGRTPCGVRKAPAVAPTASVSGQVSLFRVG